jgi:hypothetical protein
MTEPPLLVPRTPLLGALVLLPVMANIVLTDILFGIGALLMSVLLTLLLVRIVWPHVPALREVVFKETSAGKLPTWLWVGVIVLVLVGAFAFNGMVRDGSTLETPVTGVWEIQRVGDEFEHGWVGGRVYFERNRAHLAVLPSDLVDGSARHRYEVDEDGHVLIRADWLGEESPLRMEGTLQGEDRLLLRGLDPLGYGELLLLRVPVES